MENSPTFESIKAGWEKKYDDGIAKNLEEKLRAKLREYRSREGYIEELILDGGHVKEVENQNTVVFWAYVGSSFKVETRDRKFYYFQDVFKADNAPAVNKTVLLVEIGNKTRGDDEGHGGQTIED